MPAVDRLVADADRRDITQRFGSVPYERVGRIDQVGVEPFRMLQLRFRVLVRVVK